MKGSSSNTQITSALPSSRKQHTVKIYVSINDAPLSTRLTICLDLIFVPIILQKPANSQATKPLLAQGWLNSLNPKTYKQDCLEPAQQSGGGGLVVLYITMLVLFFFASVMTLGDWEKTAGDSTLSKQIKIVPAWKTATEPDLTERKERHGMREQTEAEDMWGHEEREETCIDKEMIFRVFVNETLESALIRSSSPTLFYRGLNKWHVQSEKRKYLWVRLVCSNGKET